MNIKIIRGTKHIGGNIVEVSTNSTKILLDCGAMLPPLDDDGSFKDDIVVAGLFDNNPQYDAVFISHYHGDHCGLIHKINESIPIYCSNKAKSVLEAVWKYTDSATRELKPFNFLETIIIGNIKVTPQRVNHSAYDSCIFEIEADGKRIIYTGDYKDINDIEPVGKVDLLITEGTMLDRNMQEYRTERDVEEEFANVIKNTKGRVFVLVSSSNIDRIQSIVNARNVVDANRKMMHDIFMKSVLEAMNKNIVSKYGFVFYAIGENRIGSKAVLDYYCERGEATSYKRIAEIKNGIVFIRQSMYGKLCKLKEDGLDFNDSSFVFSAWKGYAKDKNFKRLISFFENEGVETKYIHTSGHADVMEIKKMCEHFNPIKLICIHSENSSKIKDLVGCEVVNIDDNQEYKI